MLSMLISEGFFVFKKAPFLQSMWILGVCFLIPTKRGIKSTTQNLTPFKKNLVALYQNQGVSRSCTISERQLVIKLMSRSLLQAGSS